WIHREIVRAGAIALVQHLVPMLAAIGGTKDAALGVRTKRVAERRDVDDVGIMRMTAKAADVARIAQADVLPALAAVSRTVHAVPMRDVVADAAFAGTHVQHVWVGVSDGHGANGRRAEVAV